MPMPPTPARIHLLPALRAPLAAVIRRKPTRVSHIMLWNTQTDTLEHGSWFQGRLYELRCDLSPDGRWMAYLAMGRRGDVWTGLCCPPRLRAIAHWPGIDTRFGGGHWTPDGRFLLNSPFSGEDPQASIQFDPRTEDRPPFPIEPAPATAHSEDEGVLYPRLARDGWERAGPMGEEREVEDARTYTVICENDPGWFSRPSHEHPALRMYSRGYAGRRLFEFALDDHPKLLGPDVSWACWDSRGQLLVARSGRIERWSLADIHRGRPGASHDLEHLAPPSTQRGASDGTPDQIDPTPPRAP